MTSSCVCFLSVSLLRCSLVAIGISLSGGHAGAQDSKDEKKADPPKVAICSPLAVSVSGITKVVVRGWKLDSASEVRSSSPQVSFKVLSATSTAVPNGQDAKQVGDTQLELEVTVAEGVEPGEVMMTVISPAGESQSHRLLIGSVHPLIAEHEPNDGFQQAQQIQIPQVIDGQIHGDRNVDVFEFEIAEPQSITMEVLARRHGSGFDSLLTLFDHQGQIVALNDDHEDTTDSHLTATVPAGKYFISLQDAQDHGGPAHPYRLLVQSKE